jgi:hypothetical protein
MLRVNEMKSLTIEALVGDLTPVHRVSPRLGLGIVALMTLASVLGIAATYGLRPDILAGNVQPIIMVRGGLLLLLGLASLFAVVAAARPGIGQSSTGWRWALAAAALFPATAAILAMGRGEEALEAVSSTSAYYCFGISGASGLVIGAALTLWLRRGAPTSPQRTAWLVGLTAGSLGTFAYSLHCPSDTVYYAGFWYSLAVGMCAITARAVVPALIRW